MFGCGCLWLVNKECKKQIVKIFTFVLTVLFSVQYKTANKNFFFFKVSARYVKLSIKRLKPGTIIKINLGLFQIINKLVI